jgi:hypothetical protein
MIFVDSSCHFLITERTADYSVIHGGTGTERKWSRDRKKVQSLGQGNELNLTYAPHFRMSGVRVFGET